MFFRIVRQLGEFDADSIALAVAHHAYSANLGVLHIDGELQPHSWSEIASRLDEASAQAHIRAHAPAGSPAERRLDARACPHRLPLRIATLGAVLEITHTVGISLRLVDPLRIETVHRMRWETDAPVRRDVPLYLHSDVSH